MKEFALTFNGSTLLFFLFLIILSALSIYVYRRTNPPVPKWLRYVLTGLRMAALIIVFFILFEPVLKLSWNRTEKPIIAVLLDNSASMTIVDDQQSRADKAKSILKSPLFTEGTKEVDFAFYQFSNALSPLSIEQIDSVAFTSDGTDLATALRQMREQNIDRYLAAIILLSDGINNLGENPLRYAEEMNIPIFPVSVGQVIQQNDIIISKVMTNRITYANNEVPVDITIKAIGYAGKKIEVKLLKENRVVDSKFVVTGDELESHIRLKFIPTEPGFQKYLVQIPVLENELTDKNNRKAFYVKVLKSRMKILYLSGAPGADYSFIKRILTADENVEADFWVAKKNQHFYQGDFPDDINKLKNYDCIILQNFPPRNYSTRALSTLKRLLEIKSIPLFFIAGNNVNYQGLTPLRNFLPMEIPGREFREMMVTPVITAQGINHPIIRISEDQYENQNLWLDVPPIFYSLRNVRPYPGSEVLLRAESVQRDIRVANKDLPLVVSRKAGTNKSLAVLGYGIWRWDLLMWGVGKTNELFRQFLNNSIRWLVNREDSKTVRIYPDQEIYRNGQQVTFTAEVYNENYIPLDGAEIDLQISNKTQTFIISLSGMGNGKYEGVFPAIEGGDYDYEGVARFKGRLVGRDKGQFSVEEFNLEYLQTQVDENFLKQLALKTGGEFIADSSLTTLPDKLKFPLRSRLETREWHLWNKLMLLILVILLLSIEWFIRKRSGML